MNEVGKPYSPTVGGIARAALMWLGALALALALIKGAIACPFAQLTGVPCPVCGSGRSMRALWAGDWASYWRHNPLAPFAVWLVVAIVGVWGVGIVRTGRWAPTFAASTTRRLTQLIVLLFGAEWLLWCARWFGLLGGPVPV